MQTFSLILGLGAALGLAATAWQSADKQAEGMVDAGLAALLGSLLAGRAAYVAAQWGYYQAHLAEIPQPWLGGLSASGALLGAMLGLLVLGLLTPRSSGASRSSGAPRSPGTLADALLPLLAALTVSAWLACWLDGTAYGPRAAAWWALEARDEWGQLAPRLPLQAIGALLALGWFGLLERFRPALARPGQLAGLACLGLALELFGLSFLRADPAPLWRSLRLDAWGALAAAAFALLWLLFTLRGKHET